MGVEKMNVQTSQEEETDGTGKRLRRNTERMEKLYCTKVSKYKDKLHQVEDLISVHILNSATIPNETVKTEKDAEFNWNGI